MRVYNDCVLRNHDYAYISYAQYGRRYDGFVINKDDRMYLITSDIGLQGLYPDGLALELGDTYGSWMLHIDGTISSILSSRLNCENIVFLQGNFEHHAAIKEWLESQGYNEIINLYPSETMNDESMTNFNLPNYENESVYSGLCAYHYHHGNYMNRPKIPFRGHRIGVELEVEFNSNDERYAFCDKPSNWFYCETDGSLNDYGCEIITIPLLPKDAKSIDVWQSLCDSLTHANSWDTGRCGLHVHIGREILGKTEEQKSETLGRLLYLYHHYIKDTRLNCKIYGRSSGYHERDGKTRIGDAAVLLGKEVLKSKDVAARVKNAMIEKADETRYFDINLKNTCTIEFRKGRGSINPKRIALVVEYCERLCIYAKSTPWQQISYDDFVAFLIATTKNEDLKRLVQEWS